MEVIRQKKEPIIAGILSFFLAGLGHLYCGQIIKGIIFIIVDIILWSTVVGALAFNVFAIIDSVNIAKKMNEELEQIEIGEAEEENVKKNQEQELIQQTTVDLPKFKENLSKIFKLYENNIYTEDEFIRKKNEIINELTFKKINCEVEDFLFGIASLKEKDILSDNDITKIKSHLL